MWVPAVLLAFATLLVSAAEQCDVVSSGPVCLNSGSSVLMPSAVAHGLGGHWTFDGPTAVDSSGNGNHGVGSLQHGPSPAGGGYSARFDKGFLMVPDNRLFHSRDFTYQLWVYLLEDPAGQAQEAPGWCPIVRKGIYIPAAEKIVNNPALMINRNTGKLRAAVSTSVSSAGDGEFVESNARLQRNRWIHLAIAHHTGTSGSSRLLLYVNGILDAKLVLRGVPESNEYPLYVGGDPFTAEDCGFTMYVDEVKMLTRPASPHELQAEAAPAFAGIEPSFTHLGCLSCSLDEAMHSCPATRHICSSLELHTGGYQVARTMGWLTAGSHVWTHAAVLKARGGQEHPPMVGQAPAGTGPSMGLALCCEGPMD